MKNNTRKILLALVLVFTLVMSLVTVPALAEETGTKTFYFSNNKWWSNVNVHYWGGANESTWPGVAATYVETNDYGESIYSITVPADVTHIIFNNGSGEQTVDIDLSLYTTDGFYLTDKNGEGKYEVGTYAYTASGNQNPGTDNPGTNTPGTVTPDVEGLELAIGDYYLAGYINGADYGIGDDSGNLGSYLFVNGKLTVEFTQNCYVIIKNSSNTSYWTQQYVGSGNSATYYNSSTGANEKMLVPGGNVTFTLYKGDGDTFVLTYTVESGSIIETPSIDEEDTVRVYAGNSAEWDTVYYYCWVSGGSEYISWPGIEMDLDENGYWYADVPKACDNIIFNNGNNGQQTEDLKTPFDDKNVCDIAGCLKGSGKINSWFTKAEYKPSTPLLREDTNREVTLVLKNDANWSAVYVYYWSLDGMAGAEWPGIQLEAAADGLYYAVIPEGNYYVIFNNGQGGEGNQTGDMVIPTDDNVLYNNADGSWSVMRLEANHPSNGGNSTGDNTNNQAGAKGMTFLQKIAKALLLFLRSIEDFFKGMFVKK